jgi:hypothetical protein
MAGFDNDRRATGVHDDTWARGVVLESRGKKIALFVLDAIGYFNNEVQTIRTLVDPGLGIDSINVTSTHVHEGPDTMGLWGRDQLTTGVDLGYLRRLRVLVTLDDDAMANEMRGHLLDARSATPSLETLVHALLPEKFVDHTHADAILTLTNQLGGETLVRGLGNGVIVRSLRQPGFARAVADAFGRSPTAAAWCG